MKTKAEFKQLKKRISEETALNIGYYNEVLTILPEYSILEATRRAAKLVSDNTPDAEVRNILVTESVKAMSYQDFKDIAGYFFGGRN